MRWRKIYGLLLLAATHQALHAQAPYSAFLAAAQSDPAVVAFDRQGRYLDGKPYRLSPLQKLEARTESNQLDPNRQDYALRINPANPWEMRNNAQYFRELSASLMLERSMVFKEMLLERYILVIDLVTCRAEEELARRDVALAQAYVHALERQQLSGYFDAGDFVELKLDEMDKVVALEEEAFETADKIRQVEILHPEATSATTWSLEQVVSVGRIGRIVDSLSQRASATTTLAYYQKRIAVAEREYALEKSNINVGFLQAQYQQFRVEQDRKPWNLSLGVTIPLVNPNRGDMTKRRLKVIESEQEMEEAKIDARAGDVRLKAQLKSLMVRYNDMQAKIGRLNVSSLSETLSTIEKSNPVAGVRFKANLLKLEMLALKLQQEILLTYANWLAATDVLQEMPLVNYLAPNLEILQR